MSDKLTRIQSELAQWPDVQIAILFGSIAEGLERPDSDLDLAVQMSHPITAEQKMALISHFASLFGRPVDIIDLREAGEALLGEILSKGIMLKGGSEARGDLMFKHIMDHEDFGPYQQRILQARRRQWIES